MVRDKTSQSSDKTYSESLQPDKTRKEREMLPSKMMGVIFGGCVG